MIKVCIISFSQINRDPRIIRQINALRHSAEILTVGFGKQYEDVQHIRIDVYKKSLLTMLQDTLRLLLHDYKKFYWSRYYVKQVLEKFPVNLEFNIIVANDIDSLPIALKLAMGKIPVLLDAHEYSPREFEDRFIWRVLFQNYREWLCRKYLKCASEMTTVCESISREYEKNFGVKSKLVFNAPTFVDLSSSLVDPNNIKIIHHGGANRSRKIELMIKMSSYLEERFSLYLMLVPSDQGYLEELSKLIKNYPRVFILPPVTVQEIPTFLNRYDIGLYILPPINFNNYYALPNKIFEFIQGRLAIAVSPNPEMASIVRHFDLGCVADDYTPQAMANVINKLSVEDIMRFKINSDSAAHSLNAEKSMANFIDIVDKLCTKPR